MASTNNPRKKKQLDQELESNTASAFDSWESPSVDADGWDWSDFGEDDGSALGGRSIRGARSGRASKEQPTGNRRKIKDHRKVQPGQTGQTGLTGRSGAITGSLSPSASGTIADPESPSASGTISNTASPAASGTLVPSESGTIRGADASVSGSLDFSNLPPDIDDIEDAGMISDGALAAQEFLQEKQDERELAKAREKVRKRRRRIVGAIIAVIVCAIIATVVAIVMAFSTFRWNTYDDMHDFLGTWHVIGTDSEIVITEDYIQLTDDVAYKYELDPDAKTIEFKFGNLVGSGHYRFSLDREKLSIMDGQFEWGQTLSEDAQWTLDAWIDQTFNDTEKSPSGKDNITELERVPDIPESTDITEPSDE